MLERWVDIVDRRPKKGVDICCFARMSIVSVEKGNCYGGGELGKVRSQKRDDFIVVRGIEVGLCCCHPNLPLCLPNGAGLSAFSSNTISSAGRAGGRETLYFPGTSCAICTVM